MGILEKLFGSDEEPSKDLVIENPTATDDLQGTFRGEQVTFSAEQSPNEVWTCLTGTSAGEGESPVILLDGHDHVQFGYTFDAIDQVGVANTGTVTLTLPAASGAKAFVFDAEGDRVYTEDIDVGVTDIDLSSDGTYLALALEEPLGRVTITVPESGDRRTTFDSDIPDPAIAFEIHEDEPVLFLSDADGRYRGIDVDGTVVWRSDRRREEERLRELVAEGTVGSLSEAIESLSAMYEDPEGSHHRPTIARQLAETHWNLAREIGTAEGSTEEWERNLEEARQYYVEGLPNPDAIQGVRKVTRALADVYLERGEIDTAEAVLETAADLEAEHDIELQTGELQARLEDGSE